MLVPIKVRALVLSFALMLFVGSALATDVTGAGSSFVYPVLSKWAADYAAKTGDKINYQSVGSGAGIAQIKASTVDFGASDKPLKPSELSEAGLAQFPVVIGGVVPVVHVPGIQAGQMKFTGALLADIFLGKVIKWNDAAITQLNPDLKLPDKLITVVHRSDGSGTTFNWANYLSKVSDEWKTKVGEGTSVNWPTGVGGKGNEGVSAYVNQLDGALGYVELTYALQNKMAYAQVKNSAGNFITPSLASFQKAAESAEWTKEPDFYQIITDAPGAESWPIAASVFVLMHKQPTNAANSKAALGFFKYALENGQDQAHTLQYVPLPPALVQQIETYWSQQIH
ncbi:MAG TPA: phosphate ABC transporter substrate-binding protein PstS [bacterium]|jgi:phosphate transport system substrate-binding protein